MTALIETVGSVATVLAVSGVVLNNRRLIWCFPIWMVSNSLTLLCHVWLAAWALTARDAIFLLLAVEGWRKWGLAARNGERHV